MNSGEKHFKAEKENTRYIDDGSRGIKMSKNEDTYTRISFGRKKRLMIDTEGLDEDPAAKENYGC